MKSKEMSEKCVSGSEDSVKISCHTCVDIIDFNDITLFPLFFGTFFELAHDIPHAQLLQLDRAVQNVVNKGRDWWNDIVSFEDEQVVFAVAVGVVGEFWTT